MLRALARGLPGRRLTRAPAGAFAAVALIWAPLSGGCSWLHSVEPAPPPPVAVPGAFTRTSSTSGPEEAGRWWSAFADPKLEGLIDHALRSSLDLVRAYARLDQAVALADRAGAGRWPQLSADANVSRSKTLFNGGDRLGGAIAVESNRFELSAAASYEVDLWGRVHSLDEAAKNDLAATARDVETMTMSVAAQVAETYFAILEQRAVADLLSTQIEINRTFLELVELRFSQGMATALDVFQQRQQVAAIEASVPLVEARDQVLRHQLAVLLGKAPGATALELEGNLLPDVPPLPAVGVPAELVQRRPDVHAAQLRVVASDYRVGAAIADRFPTIRLTGRAGFQSFELADLFKDWVWNLAAGITGPLFDGGARAAEVDRSRAVLEESLAAYGQTVLVALREVEDALVQEQKQRAYLVRLDAQLVAARATLAEARTRYVNGLSDYLPVLTALRAVQQVEQAKVSAQRQLLSYRVQLCRALGGNWASEVERPPMLSRNLTGEDSHE